MHNQTKTRYSEFYATRAPGIYPNEALVRIFMGSYPGLNLAKEFDYSTTKICDLSCGDGRNLRLFSNLGMKLYATEVTDSIVANVKSLMQKSDLVCDIQTGDNHSIPFIDNSFDIIVSWNACYYQGVKCAFDKTLSEISRVLRPNGAFVFSVPRKDNFIFNGCNSIDEKYVEIVNDPYNGIRNGEIMRRFSSAIDLEETISTAFGRIHVCESVIDYFGMQNSHYFGVCFKPGLRSLGD